MAKQENSGTSPVNGLEKWFEGIYKNAPSLPEGFRKWLANNVWWLALVGGVLGLLSALGMLEVARVADNVMYNMGTYSLAYGGNYRTLIWISFIVTVIQSVLLLMAYKGLKAHRKSGWNLLFYSGLLSLIMTVVYLVTAGYGLGNALGSLIGVAISFYFLFQIRSYFTSRA